MDMNTIIRRVETLSATYLEAVTEFLDIIFMEIGQSIIKHISKWI
ncbi:MAG: hypothetical protein WAL81_06930 [Methanobacterium sp.]